MPVRRCLRPLPRLILAGLAGLILAAVSGVETARADGGDSRPLTPAETAFFRKVLPALAQAMPPAPAGWQVSEQGDTAPPPRLDGGGLGEPLQASYRVAWQDFARKAKAQEAQAAAGVEVAQRQMAEPSTADQHKRMEALGEKLGAAAQRGDQAEVLRLQKQMEEVSLAMAKVYDRNDRELKAAMDSHQVRDVDASVTILVNAFGEDFIGWATADKPVAGLAVYRQEGEDAPRFGWREGTTWVFLGPGWKLIRTEDSAHMENEPRAGLASTKVQTLVVRVRGDAKRARKIVEAMDWNALKALVR